MNENEDILEKERENYYQASEQLSKLKAVIIGQDPYPNNAMGIAFCKRCFDKLFENSCCGQHLLFSLGLTKKCILKHFEKPEDVFYYLLENGIAILNISYKLLDAPFIPGQTSKDFNDKLFSKNEKKILEARNFNQSFLKKSEKIFVLGKSKTSAIFLEYYKEFKATETLLHPSNYTRDSAEWRKIWGSRYLINKITSSIAEDSKI
jgi:hypothetical protein